MKQILDKTYFGNRITGVKEDAEPVTQPGSMDFTGTKGQYMAMDYNSSDSLIKDGSRGITNIEYDNLGNPVKITYSNGNTTENVYSSAGEKQKSVHTTGMASAVMSDTGLSAIDLSSETFSGTETIEYRGPVIYRNGSIDMVLFDGGYCTIDVAGGVTFHYYTKDYLGNNRAVINGTTGAVEQTVSYYPYGGVIADLGTGHGLQPYKFGGKELMTANGLNEYDSGARQYWHAVPSFNRIDPLCEKYYWLSPYLYCGNDPVNAVDPDGKKWKITSSRDEDGRLRIRMHITGVVIKKVPHDIDINKFAKVISEQINDTFTLSGDNFSVNMTSDIRVVSGDNAINESDHVFAIVPQSKLSDNETLASADTNGLLVKIGVQLTKDALSGKNTRSIPHELGHTGGLNDNPNIRDRNLNLMTQAQNIPDIKNLNNANKLSKFQINTIIKNYNHRNINLRSPIIWDWFENKLIHVSQVQLADFRL